MRNQYEDFLNGKESVPSSSESALLKTIKRKMNPSPVGLFLKIFSIHILVGSLSLAICHQFGLNPFGTSYSLADWFMQVGGHGVCMVACGVLFTSLSILGSYGFLTLEEIQTLRRTEWLQVSSLALLSLGALAFFGAELILTFSILWLLGAVTGGWIAGRAVYSLRTVRFN